MAAEAKKKKVESIKNGLSNIKRQTEGLEFLNIFCMRETRACFSYNLRGVHCKHSIFSFVPVLLWCFRSLSRRAISHVLPLLTFPVNRPFKVHFALETDDNSPSERQWAIIPILCVDRMPPFSFSGASYWNWTFCHLGPVGATPDPRLASITSLSCPFFAEQSDSLRNCLIEQACGIALVITSKMLTGLNLLLLACFHCQIEFKFLPCSAVQKCIKMGSLATNLSEFSLECPTDILRSSGRYKGISKALEDYKNVLL